MTRERVQKKSYQESLEEIKEKMKEKRNKRLAGASALGRGQKRMVNKTSALNSSLNIMKGVQQNNKMLALALQTEKEKVRQANVVILQLKREQQALFLHLLLLKKKLKEQEALTASASEANPPVIDVDPQQVASARMSRSPEIVEELISCKVSPICSDPSKESKQHECNKEFILPSTVGVRRRITERRSRRQSGRLWNQKLLVDTEPVAELEADTSSPVPTEGGYLAQVQPEAESEMANPIDTMEPQHSTPEPAPTNKGRQQLSSKPAQHQQQPRSKQPEPASRKPERGRKPERAPLKKPWENPKPRARSKSRDRSATRAKAAPPPQGNKLNTSLGFNDTFDFDCEGAVHVTPFRAKAEDGQGATPIGVEASQPAQVLTEAPSADSKQNESTLSPSSESEDSLYIPHKTKRRRHSPEKTTSITTRRGRLSRADRQNENNPPKQKLDVLRDEKSSPEVASSLKRKKPDPTKSGWKKIITTMEPLGVQMEDGCLPSVSPLVEAEMMRLDNVLSNFGELVCEAPSLLPHQTPQRPKTCKKRGLGVRSSRRGLSLCDVTNLSPAAYRKFSSDARCPTPAPARKRRCTMVVDYKEPSLNAKLRRGDKFTDVEFLSSPIFKSGKRSVQKSRKSVNNQQKYNESFVGCR